MSPTRSTRPGKPGKKRKARKACKGITKHILVQRNKSWPQTIKQQIKARIDSLGQLPPEIILEVMKWTNLQDLGKLLLINKDISVLASTSKRSIVKSIQSNQYPEYHQLFGVFKEETQLHKDNLSAYMHTQRWWIWKDDWECEHREETYKDKPRGSRSFPQLLRTGPIDRLKFFAALAEKIEKTAAALKVEEGEDFDVGKEEVTRQALVLFWRLQWMDQPGLEYLCKMHDMALDFLDMQQQLFAAETSEVMSRYQEILKLVGSGLWKRLELWDFTRAWWIENIDLIKSQRRMSAGEVGIWVRQLTAELVVEVVSKIGIDRAIRLKHADVCDWDTLWINGQMADRLMELLDAMVPILKHGGEILNYGFRETVGLLPEDIADEWVGILEESGPISGSF
ncbi:MAG: hypothetical protein Q9192_007219 [Flavoplaca navasiana]